MSAGRPPVEPDREAMRDFDDVERITAAVRRWTISVLLFGLVPWLVLLATVPQLTGLSLPASFAFSTTTAIAIVLLCERYRRRGERAARTAAAGGKQGGPRQPMSAATAVLLTLGGVVVLVYIMFVIVIILRG